MVDGVDEGGKAIGHFEATGVRPSFMHRLESSGVRLPANLFAARRLG
jgi:pilus assembly protein CpaF